MIRRTATLMTVLAAMTLGFASNMVQAEDKQPTACEKKADKKKISDAKKRAAYIKKCEKKAQKAK